MRKANPLLDDRRLLFGRGTAKSGGSGLDDRNLLLVTGHDAPQSVGLDTYGVFHVGKAAGREDCLEGLRVAGVGWLL